MNQEEVQALQGNLIHIPLVQGYISYLRKKSSGLLSAGGFAFEDNISLALSSYISLSNISDISPLLSNLLSREQSSDSILFGKSNLFPLGPGSRFISDDSLEKLKKRTNQSLEIFGLIWPEFGFLCRHLFKKISLLPLDYEYESFSDPKILSEVFFKSDRVEMTDLIEILSHEIAHQYLFVISADKKFKIDDSLYQMKNSAIRNSLRPTIGILHALFAEAFMLISFDQLAKNPALMERFSIEANEVIEKKEKIKNLYLKERETLGDIPLQCHPLVAKIISYIEDRSQGNIL